MTRTADVVIVGGGIIGVSIAYALAARKVGRVVLIEKDALASGASGRSMSVVRMHYTNEWDARLAWASFPTFNDWSEVMGEPPVFTRTGFLNIVSPKYAENLRRNVEILRAIGIKTVALSPHEVKTIQPFVNVEDIGAAAYEPDGGYVNPVDAVTGFRRRALELKAQVLEWTPVTAIARQEGRVIGVETPSGRISAPVVVVAAGAWAPRLCREVGVDVPARAKGLDVVVVARPPELAPPHVVFRDYNQGSTIRPESGILTMAGVPCFTWDLDPDTAPTGLPPEASDEGAKILTHRMPAMERATLAHGFRAFDCYSADLHAIMGRVDGIDGLYLATAFSGAGFKIAPAVGVCMAEVIADGKATTVDISAFSLERFRTGRSLEGPYQYAPWKAHLERPPDDSQGTSRGRPHEHRET